MRGLDFNPIQQNLLASGAINGELQVFDLHNPDKTHSTGPRSTKLDEITAVQWNPSVAHILAASSSSGYTSVWDLRQKREMLSLTYGGGAATAAQGNPMNRGGFGSMVGGGKSGMSSVVWHPNNPTRLITASEDDNSPVVMVWDLRNSLAPEKILSGHDKGVLSLSWCNQDSDLLLSCGKDNRTICWNPQSCEIVAELPSSDNWSFQTAWCPRNPDLVATASFDGKIGIHSLQNTQVASNTKPQQQQQNASVDDIFGSQIQNNLQDSSNATPLSLTQPPKWLRPPVSVSFGFGGQLTTIKPAPSVPGQPARSILQLQTVVTEPDVVDRAKRLADAIGSQQQLGDFCEEMAKAEGGDASAIAGWKALRSLFTTNSRDELVTLLGFSKDEIATQVSEAIKKYKSKIEPQDKPGSDSDRTPKDSAVSFASETATKDEPSGATTPKAESVDDKTGAATPSEVSVTTDVTKKTEVESETTEQSLFDDDQGGIGTPHIDTGSGAHFFSSIGGMRNALPEHMQVPYHAYAKDSSVAATIGSRASSVASDTMKSNTFKIYPTNESEVDRLVTRALVVGDFESAVTLCLSVERFADALVLAVRGGPELLARTQKAYFERQTTTLPYLRLFQSIVSEDLSDVVQNADLTEWQEVFVVLCTFAKVDEFNNLTEQLGQRIEFKSRTVQGGSATANTSDRAKELRKNALLCYLAAGRLEKAVNIWIDEMQEEEDAAVKGEVPSMTEKTSRYTAHVRALQTFMEKVAVFKSATNYTDRDLAQPTQSASAAESGARTYQLSALYDRYYEYADLLATQGQTGLAVHYIKQTPADYKSGKIQDSGINGARARYMMGANGSLPEQQPTASTSNLGAAGASTRQGQAAASAFTPYQPFTPPVPQHISPASTAQGVSTPYNPYQAAPASQSVAHQQGPYVPANMSQGTSTSGPYGAGSSFSQPSNNTYGAYGAPPAAPQANSLPPPPMGRARGDDATPPIPAAQRRDIPGWNDAPSLQSQAPKRTGSAAGKPQPIMSPFPEGQGSISPAQTPGGMQQQGGAPFAPPPARGQGLGIAPPPRGAIPPRPASTQQQPPPPPQHAQPRVMSPPMPQGPPPGAIAGPPPARAMSPLVPAGQRVMSPPQSSNAPSLNAGPYAPPPGARAGPPPGTQGPPQGSVSSSRPPSAAPPAPAGPRYRECQCTTSVE